MRYFSANRLADLWAEVRDSYWLIPCLMVLGAIGLAVGMSYVDLVLPNVAKSNAGWATALNAGEARTILATLAGSMATIVGVVFSITIVALQLASSQFGPHVLRSFLTDRGSQMSLGALLASFTYSLLVIVVIRGSGEFVPYASTYMGILIGLGAIGMLIYFINHVAKLLRVETVIASLAREVERATEEVFPEQIGEGERVERESPPAVPACFEDNACRIVAREGGYIRRLDDAALMRLAQEHDLLVRLDVRPGDFLLPDGLLMAVAPADRVDDALARRLEDTVLFGTQRTPEQDVVFALHHLDEIAVRALSPAINAPFSALPAIDQIGRGLCRLVARRMPAPCRRDADGTVRVLVMRPLTLVGVVREAVGPIAGAAVRDAGVMARLIEVVQLVASRAVVELDRTELRALAAELAQEGEQATSTPRERAIIRAAAELTGVSAAAVGRLA